jgi:hypothetical protein
MAHVPDLESDEIASAQLAVDAQVEQREFAYATLHLEADAERPDVLELGSSTLLVGYDGRLRNERAKWHFRP